MADQSANAVMGSQTTDSPHTSRKIDVCLVAENYYPVLTGAGERFRRYAPGLRARGVELRIITVNRDNHADREIIAGTPILRLPTPKNPNLFNGTGSVADVLLHGAVNYFQINNQWPDVLHILTHPLQGVPYVWRARCYGIPCVNSITLMPWETHSKIERLKDFLHHWLRYSPFNLIITNNQVMEHRMTQLGISSKRIINIPNGVDLSRFHPVSSSDEQAKLRKELGLGVGDEIILFVGYIVPRKGIDLLAEAWSEIARMRPAAHLVLVGPYEQRSQAEIVGRDTPTFFAKIERIIQESPAPERVSFMGEVENVESFMQAADVFVFPSRREGSPNALTEAMAAGLPCVITPFSGLSVEFGAPGREFLLASFTSDSIAENINSILSNLLQKEKIGRAARKFAEENFDVARSLDLYSDMYKRLSSKRKGQRNVHGHAES
jgi:glycosyltransferase involved in cell wall biosynthesis